MPHQWKGQDPRQREFDFRVKTARALLKSFGISATAKHLLRVLIGQKDEYPDGVVLLTIEVMMLAVESKDPRTVKTALKELEYAEFLEIVRRPRRGRDDEPYQIRVRFPNVWERGGLVFGDSSGEQRLQPGAQNLRDKQQSLQPIEQTLRAPSPPPHYSLSRKVSGQEELPPSETRSTDARWQDAERAIYSGWWMSPDGELRGVDQAAPVVAAARQRGCTPEEIIGLLKYAKTRTDLQSPPGALYSRIAIQFPDRPIAEGWPRANDDHAPAHPPATQVNAARVHSDGPKFWDDFSDGEALQ